MQKLKIKEILVIIGIGCCTGVVFNLVWANRVPFITPSKAEIYAQKEIRTITLEEAKKKHSQGVAIFLDARDANEYHLKHIESALNLPVRHFELYYAKMKNLLPKDAEIIVYCEGEECGASLRLTEELMKLKYEAVKVFLAGWIEWNRAAYPAEKSISD